MKWIASLLLIAILALALFAKAPTAQAGLKNGPAPTPTITPTSQVVSRT